jgi:hypothetical protein
MTHHDTCISTGIAKSPSTSTTLRRNTSYTELSSIQSV